MNITEVKIRKLLTEKRLRAIVSVTIDNTITIHDIKVIQGDDRLFIAMPSRKEDDGTYRDIVHPIDAAARQQLEEAVLGAYREEVKAKEDNYK